MAERMTMRLWEPAQAHKSIMHAWAECIKPMLIGGHRLVLEVKPEPRSSEQNRLLHAALTDIAQQVEWMGQKFTVEVWKRLCMASWLREKKEQPMLIPALDGNGFDVIFERTSKLSRTQCSELLEWCFAFGAEHEVKFRERGMEDGPG